METAAPLLDRRLDPSTSEIRLLEVPSDGSEDWGLITVSLDDKPEYCALSYVWGEKKHLEKIVLQGQCKEVTPNLASALSRIRRGSLGGASTPIKNFWVDAICINQEDINERSQQVQLMHRIFKYAQAVYAWVGPKDYSLAFRTIRKLADKVALNHPSASLFKARDQLGIALSSSSNMPPFELEWLQGYTDLCDETLDAEFPFKNDAWNSIRDLFLDQYWKRVWIYQEVVLANRLHLFSSGDMTLTRQDLFMFTRSYKNLDLWSKVDKGEVQRPEFLCQTVWDGLVRFPPHDGINAIQDARSTISISYLEDWIVYPRTSWKETIAATRLVATDPRDYIYGLLAVSRIPMTPDYAKSVTEVYTEYVGGWMKASKEARDNPRRWVQLPSSIPPLGFLSLAGAGHFGSSGDFPFPSWAPNFPKNALRNETQLLRVPDLRDIRREDPTHYPHFDSTGNLCVWGIKIEAVLYTSNFARPNTIDRETIQKLILGIGQCFRRYTSRHPHYISGITSWQAMARLIFKKVSEGVTRAMVYSLLTLAAMTSRYVRENPRDGLDAGDSPDSFLFPTGWETQLYERAFPGKDLTRLGCSDNPLADKESHMQELWEHVILMYGRMVDRSIFETKGGYLGRGPLDVREGDLLCLLRDYDQPVLLRKLGDHYTFVGTVFVVDLRPDEWIQDNSPGLEWLKLQ